MGLGTAAPVRGVQARGGGTAAASGSLGWTRPEGEGGAEAAAPATCVALDLARTPGRGLGVLSAAFQESSQGSRESLCLGRAMLGRHPVGVAPCVL